jgi:hypothetical protein
LILFTASVLISGVLVFLKFKDDNAVVHAVMSDNATGYAWSENIGWISFNCTDVGCGQDYGVKLDSSGSFSGYAWSENIGWISFQENDPPDFTYSANCDTPASCDDATDNCTACYNSTDEIVHGWAKILILGDDGWLKMSDDSIAEWNGNGVSIEFSGANRGVFHGWAWNNSGICVGDDGNYEDCDCTTDCANDCTGADTCEYKTGIGWVSFNCSNKNTCNAGDNIGDACDDDSDCLNGGAGSCVDTCTNFSDYKVTIDFPPTVVGNPMTDPGNWSYANACGIFGALQAQLTWTYSDPPSDTQSFYKIIFDDSDHLLSELDAMTDNTDALLPLVTSKLPGAAGSFFPTQTNAHGRIVSLDYGTPYYWWIKVWDDIDGDSGWVQFDDPANTDGDIGDDKNKTFTTYLHEFPDVFFRIFPPKPSEEEDALFYDGNEAGQSKYYTVGFPDSNPVDCDDTDCDWLWSIIPASVIDDETASTTIITINSPDPEVTSTVTDSDNYYCSSSTVVSTNVPLPTWKEVKP